MRIPEIPYRSNFAPEPNKSYGYENETDIDSDYRYDASDDRMQGDAEVCSGKTALYNHTTAAGSIGRYLLQDKVQFRKEEG